MTYDVVCAECGYDFSISMISGTMVMWRVCYKCGTVNVFDHRTQALRLPTDAEVKTLSQPVRNMIADVQREVCGL